MSLTFGLKTPRDLLDKLKRDAALLDQEVTSDRFFNFVVTGWSMIDWIRNDSSIPRTARVAVQNMYNDRWIKICGDLATASKHFLLDLRKPITLRADSQQGWGYGRYGKGGYGVGEEEILMTMNDGTTVTCLELVTGVIESWDGFFARQAV